MRPRKRIPREFKLYAIRIPEKWQQGNSTPGKFPMRLVAHNHTVEPTASSRVLIVSVRQYGGYTYARCYLPGNS